MLTDEDRKYILNEFLVNMFSISNKEYQERVWIRGEGPECDDFTETVCHFFDDGNPIIKNYKDYGINDDQYHLLEKFRDEFDAFVSGDRPFLPEEFIHSPEWEKIMKMAEKVLEAFDYKKR